MRRVYPTERTAIVEFGSFISDVPVVESVSPSGQQLVFHDHCLPDTNTL